jgi:hypothetical protein
VTAGGWLAVLDEEGRLAGLKSSRGGSGDATPRLTSFPRPRLIMAAHAHRQLRVSMSAYRSRVKVARATCRSGAVGGTGIEPESMSFLPSHAPGTMER